MDVEELKLKLKGIFGEQINFNKEFDKYAGQIKNVDENLIPWCVLLSERKIKPIPSSTTMGNLIFIKKIGSSNRCIVIKITNGEFREIHLADHAYYDKLRKVLGLKKTAKNIEKMYEELLREIGLSPNEARIYEALLQIGEASVQDISLKSKVHRRNVYDSIQKLVEKGLASEVFIKGEKHFKAINPRRLLELIKEKEERINKVLPEMQVKYEAIEEKEEAYFYRGIEGFKNYLQDILKTKETVYFIGAKAFWLDERLKHYLPRFQRERKRLGIKFMHLFDYEIKEQKPEILKIVGKPYKFLPKKYSSSTAVDIFGPYVVTFVGVKLGELEQEPIMFVMKNQKLADGYRRFFQFMWDNCKGE